MVTKIDRLARSTSDLYRIISELAEKGVAFKVTDDPTIDTTSRTGKLVMGILALIAEFENDIRRERGWHYGARNYPPGGPQQGDRISRAEYRLSYWPIRWFSS